MCDFSLFAHFEIAQFNEFSDHAPVHFNLKVNSCPYTEYIKYEDRETLWWNSELRDSCRSSIIYNLPNFSRIIETNRDNSENLVTNFACLLKEISDPLFKRITCVSRGFTDRNTKSNKKWFDAECSQVRNLYLQARSAYNRSRTDENRSELANVSCYKSLIKKKQHQFKYRQATQFEKLKRSNPRHFGSISELKHG